MNRNWLAFYGILAGFSVAIYYFIVNERELALLFVFLGIYAGFTMYYFLKILYYLECKATLNELFFYIAGMTMALFSVFLPHVLFLDTPTLVIVNLQFSNGSRTLLAVTIFSVLALPFYLTHLILSFRCFTRYEFIRWGPHSDGGINSELFSVVAFFLLGGLSSWVGWIVNDFLTFIVGLFLIISGFVFLIAR